MVVDEGYGPVLVSLALGGCSCSWLAQPGAGWLRGFQWHAAVVLLAPKEGAIKRRHMFCIVVQGAGMLVGHFPFLGSAACRYNLCRCQVCSMGCCLSF